MTFETQKSPEGRVWSLRMRLRGRTTFPFAFVDTYDHNDVCENLYCHRDPFKKFLRHFKVSPHDFKMLNLGHFRPQIGIKLKKSPPECVLKHSFRLRRCMTTRFPLADSFGPKHVCKNLQ